MSPKDKFLIMFKKGNLMIISFVLASFYHSPTKIILESHKLHKSINKNMKELTDKNIKRIWD